VTRKVNQGKHAPTLLGQRTRVKHREVGGFRALCGRARCSMFPAWMTPDSEITCPDCQALLKEVAHVA
jgi:hypothetical protein